MRTRSLTHHCGRSWSALSAVAFSFTFNRIQFLKSPVPLINFTGLIIEIDDDYSDQIGGSLCLVYLLFLQLHFALHRLAVQAVAA